MSLSFDGQRECGKRDSGFDDRRAHSFDRELYSSRLPVAAPDDNEKRIAVRLAGTEDERNSACTLINRMYAWRGYGDTHRIPATPTHSTFTAAIDDELVGTITLGVDSPAGLAIDALFRNEINTYRRVPGARVCELTKLAFDTNVPSKALLAALFHIVFIYGQRRYHCTDLFIEVNPRHRRFYQAMLGFKPAGELKTNQSVAAPSQLMHLRVADIGVQIDELAGKAEDASLRSLYPFFLSRSEEQSIHARLARPEFSRARAGDDALN